MYPRGPPHPSWAAPMPPSPLRGEGYSRSVGSAQMSMAFPSSVTACAVPPSPRGRLWGRGDGLPRRGFAPPRNDSTGGRKDPPLRGFSPILPNSTKRAIISSAHGYALALPVFGRREAPSSGGGRNFFPPPLHRRGVMQMVTYSDLIQIGILVVSIINLFLNSKKK